MAQATASANRILNLRANRTEVEHSGDKLDKGEGGVEIEFKDVHFKYPTRDIQVFAGLNMKVCWLYCELVCVPVTLTVYPDREGPIRGPSWTIRYV